MIFTEIEQSIERGVLNFVVTGAVRSGTGVIQSTLNSLPQVVCHADLFHPDKKIRKNCYLKYFSDDDYFIYNVTNPAQFLSHKVFDHPKYNELKVGVRILYDAVLRLDLFDYFEERCREGDFCLIHVIRNPVASLVSHIQAQKTNKFFTEKNKDHADSKKPFPVFLNEEELIDFIKNYESALGKILNCCDDQLVIHYKDILFDFQTTIRKVMCFLELPDPLFPVQCPIKRLPNLPIRDRIANFNILRKNLPYTYRRYLEAEDLV